MAYRRVLIIDDEAAIREVARISLELMEGWLVSACGSGAEGLAMAVHQQPDAILLDMMMPDMDGPATFKQLQGEEATRDIPVILLTGKAKPSQDDIFDSLGVQGIIKKPFDPLTLASDVFTVLGWPP